MTRYGQMTLTAVALLAAVGTAHATTITLDQCAAAGLCGQVTVTTTLTGGTIDVDVEDAPGAPDWGLFGQSGANRAFGFNVVDPDLGVVISDVTAGFAYAGAGAHAMGGGYGDFEFIINGPQNGSAAVLPLHFNVSRTGGFVSDLGLLEANDLGYIFGAHVRNNDTGISGFVAALVPEEEDPTEDHENAVPEPAALLLFGLGLATVARRMKRSQRSSTTINRK